MELQERAQKHLERMDIVVRAVEIKWGLMNLGAGGVEQLVPSELAAKFQAQWDKLSSAVTEQRYEDVILLSDGVVRGVWAMDKAAMAAGHEPGALLPIGAGLAPLPEPKQSEYVPSGRPMDEAIPF